MAKEYVFIDECGVDAPPEAVFDPLVDGTDWRVMADRPLLRVLTPVLRPAFRWNPDRAIKRAIEGLEPNAQARGGSSAASTEPEAAARNATAAGTA